jgi:hypothetical protein
MNFDNTLEPNLNEQAEVPVSRSSDSSSPPRQAELKRELRLNLEALLPSFDLNQRALLL